MACWLLEEDDDAFEAALTLLDDCEPLPIDGQQLHTQLQVSQPVAFAPNAGVWPSSSSSSTSDGAPPPSKSANKHRNGAREQRRLELRGLRSCAEGLQTQLDALTQAVEQRIERQRARTAVTAGQNDRSSSTLAMAWRELAACQLDQRLAAERENSRLKAALEDQRKLGDMLQRALHTRVMEANSSQDKRTRRVHAVPLDATDHSVFQELEAGVDAVYQEAAMVFCQADTGNNGTYLGVFADKTLPFDVATTARAAWRCVAHSLGHEKYQFSYQRELSEATGASDDTVVESFGVEIHAPDTTADFRIKQVFRRYVESDRIVIAWRSFIDPAEFKGQQLRGIRFQEKGSMVIRQPTGLQPADQVAFLRAWHIITPELPFCDGENSSQNTQELTDFVLSGSAAGSAIQMIENMLLEQSRRRASPQ
ncbi:hypothetical protein BBJ28_00022487 [Nothophytophthora sp. Chile5]|nr:hypothetical protein BBJ28_00022487 [Nothophytophthora sp. Chile5]